MVVEMIFAVAIITFAVMSLILEHHWRSHTENSRMFFLVKLFYYGGSGVFFLMALAAFGNIV